MYDLLVLFMDVSDSEASDASNDEKSHASDANRQ